jgi:hypothetical protein
VTFALQKEGAKLDGFRDWYAKRQEELKVDPTMRWLHDARTEVVHREDLVMHSRAEARLLTWRSQPFLTVEVKPDVPTGSIAQLVAQGEFPSISPPDLAETVLEVERRWVAASLPDRELLEVLADGYVSLFRLLRDFHWREMSDIALCTKADRLHSDEVSVPIIDGDPLPCMLAQRESRIVRVDLGQELPIEVRRLYPPESVARKAGRKARTRYGKVPQPRPEVIGERAEEKIFSLADVMWQQAKQILQRDRNHQPIAFMVSDSGVELVQLEIPTQAAKYLVIRNIADQVRRLGASAVVVVTEVWTLEVGKWKGFRPQDDPERGEALVLTVMTREGRDREYRVTFTRDVFGRIKFGEDHVRDALSRAHLAFTPILEALGREKEAAAIKSNPEIGDALEGGK